jgi:exodeoxyribonuclease-3
MARYWRNEKYTFCDYHAGACHNDGGISIDNLMCSRHSSDSLKAISIHRMARALEKPSDHVPVIATFAD